MKLSTMFFREKLDWHDRLVRKSMFKKHFVHFSPYEWKKMSMFYDMFELLYANAPPRKAKAGVEPDEYFGHIWRVMLIPSCVCNLQPTLRGAKIAGGHDLVEEVFMQETYPFTLKVFLGADCAACVEVLSLPGKHPQNGTSQEMREMYYGRILKNRDFDIDLTFVADHLDCLWDIEGLSIASCKRKIWEINNLCFPICDRIERKEPAAAQILREAFAIELKRIRCLAPYAGNL